MDARDPRQPRDEERWSHWMAAAQQGDRVAYERLLREVLPAVREFVGARMRRLPGAEDVVQNVLLSIHRARHTYRPERPFGPWLRAIARNAVTDAQRASARPEARSVPIEHVEASLSQPPAQGTDRGLSQELSDALSELPPQHREAVELIHLRELSVVEAAAHVGISPGALKVRAHRGYKALRARLGRPVAEEAET
jgi:RNA polymerase sigma-70 factor (ECF subfamily)